MVKVECCPCGADKKYLASNVAPMSDGSGYLGYIYCRKCGFSAPASPYVEQSIIEWNRMVSKIKASKEEVIRNRNKLAKEGFI